MHPIKNRPKNAQRFRGQAGIAFKDATFTRRIIRNRIATGADPLEETSMHLKSAVEHTKERNEAMRTYGYGENEEIFADNRRKASILALKQSLQKLREQKKPRLPQ